MRTRATPITPLRRRDRAHRRPGRHRAVVADRGRSSSTRSSSRPRPGAVHDRELRDLRPQGLRVAGPQGLARHHQLAEDPHARRARVGDTTVHGGTVVGPGVATVLVGRHARGGAGRHARLRHPTPATRRRPRSLTGSATVLIRGRPRCAAGDAAPAAPRCPSAARRWRSDEHAGPPHWATTRRSGRLGLPAALVSPDARPPTMADGRQRRAAIDEALAAPAADDGSAAG